MKVTVGVSGGVAAYKAAELVRALQAKALDVHVVMTEAAMRFVQPLTFASLTGHKVITGLWGTEDSEPNVDSAIEHIAEAQSTDILVVAPATADILARFAHGLANDFLTTLYLATPAPVVVAPAMNSEMWAHPGHAGKSPHPGRPQCAHCASWRRRSGLRNGRPRTSCGDRGNCSSST